MLGVLTDFSSSRRGKWIVLLAWIVLGAILVPLAPTLEEVTENEQSAFLPANAESTRVVELVQDRFPSDGTPAIIVLHNPSGLSDQDLTAARALNDWLLTESPANVDRTGVVSIFTTPGAEASLRAPGGQTMTMIVNVTGEAAEDPYLDTIDAIRDKADELDATGSDGFEILVSGPGGLINDLVDVFSQIDGFLILVTALLVLVLLILIYRSPVIALTPLVAVGWVFTLASAIGALAAREFGLPINGQSSGIMTVLLFGAGTDYCLFVSSRYREELAYVEDKHEAMRRAMRGVGEAIASSAGTVLVATLALLLAELRSNQSLGPLLAVAIATMLVAGLTLVPALIAVLGRFAFWPFRPKYDPALAQVHVDDEAHGAWSQIANRVAKAPVAFLVVTAVAFLVLSLGGLRLEQTFDSITALPAGTESREGFEVLRSSFPEGELAPTDVYVVLAEGTDAFDNLQGISQLTEDLAGVPGVASVSSVSHPFGLTAAQLAGDAAAAPPVGADALAAAIAAIPPEIQQEIVAGGVPAVNPEADPDLAQSIGLFSSSRRFVSPDNGVAQFSVVLERNPYSLTAIEEIPVLRDAARASAIDASLVMESSDVLVGGETATAFDTKTANDRDIRVVFPVILLAIGVILGLLLRSIIAPIYLLLTIVLSYFATLGLSTVVFQDILGQNGTGAGVPFYLFVFLVALGVDYNIFLMARIREETATHGLRAGTRRALGRTGGVITSAGIILAGTFAALMTLPLQDLFQLGFAVAVGVLLDTFIVRSLMVPAIVLLLGKWNWWPSRAAAD